MQVSSNIDLGIREIRQLTSFTKEKGADYTEYALTAFKRRVEGFMISEKCDFDTLMTKLASPEFLDHFAARIAVGETELFRDPTFWILLKNTYVANIIKDHGRARIWLPLCASGEELYSLAIMLKESGLSDRVEIFVSSLSNESLETIKRGLMDVEKLEIGTKNYSRFQGVSQLTNYYKTSGNTVTFEKSLLVNAKFYKEDLTFNHDFVHMNLILFRNKMIYFTPTLQYKVCDIMHGKLAVKGLLALGILEEIESNNSKFAALNKNESIFQRKS